MISYLSAGVCQQILVRDFSLCLPLGFPRESWTGVTASAHEAEINLR